MQSIASVATLKIEPTNQDLNQLCPEQTGQKLANVDPKECLQSGSEPTDILTLGFNLA